MDQLPNHPATTGHAAPDEKKIRSLQKEIALIEKELKDIEVGIRAFEARIHTRYAVEIARIRELGLLYKKQKRAKKEKQKEQKRRGPNYRESAGIKKRADVTKRPTFKSSTDAQERKRLYREAVLLVHPDKFINHSRETGTRSQELTIQLIDTYQNGDIETLRHLYRHIISGNAMAGSETQKTAIPDPQALAGYLARKKDELSAALEDAKQSQIHEVVSTHENPQKFIDDLASQLSLRIAQLERRTRTRR